jgi:hypothetical protein
MRKSAILQVPGGSKPVLGQWGRELRRHPLVLLACFHPF